jgi:hypothetical protein
MTQAKAGPRNALFQTLFKAPQPLHSIVAAIEAVMMMMMMISTRNDNHTRLIMVSTVLAMGMMVMVMVINP